MAARTVTDPEQPPALTRPPIAVRAVISAVFAFVLLTAFSTRVTSEAVTPRFAVLLLALGIAAPRVAAALRSSQRPQMVAGSLLVGVAAASAVSSGTLISVYGQYDWNTGWLFVAALLACWTIGATATARERRLLATAVLAGSSVNLLVALVQVVGDLSTLGLPLFEGRAVGLLGNPVHLAALATGTLGMVAWLLLHRGITWAAAVGCSAVAIQLSGSRFAIAIAAVGVVAAVGVYRSKRSVVLVAAVAAGFVAGELVVQVFADGRGAGTTALSRVSAAGADPHARVEGWKSAVDAVLERPILRSGPGRFQPGIAPHRTLALARTSPDASYIDAHNLFVEYAVTTGVPGVVLLSVWLAISVKRSRSGPWLWFALGVLGLHLVQPQNVATTPIAFLALGAATAGSHEVADRVAKPLWALGVVAAVVATIVGGRVVVGDGLLARATAARSPLMAERADRWLPPWPQPARRVAQLYVDAAEREGDDSARRKAMVWYERAAERDPTRALWWNLLAEQELDAGLVDDAASDFERALGADPYSVRALLGLAEVARAHGDTDLADSYIRRAAVVAPGHPDVVEASAAVSSQPATS